MIIFIRVDLVRVSSCINFNFRLGTASFDHSQERREDEHSTAAEKHGRGETLLEEEDVCQSSVDDGQVGDHAANGSALCLERDTHRDQSKTLDACAAQEDAKLLR